MFATERVALGLFIAALAGSAAFAQQDKKRPDVRGKVIAISDDGKTLTIEIPANKKKDGDDAKPTEVKVKIDDKTQTTYAGYDKPEDQKPHVGDLARVYYAENSKELAGKLTLAKPKKKAQ